MAAKRLFPDDSPVVLRQPKTDRLILSREIKEAATDLRLDETNLKAAHAALLHWADLERSGRLANTLDWDCGYRSSVSCADGRIVTAYFAKRVENQQRYHMGIAIWEAPPN